MCLLYNLLPDSFLTLWETNIAMKKSAFAMGKDVFSMATADGSEIRQVPVEGGSSARHQQYGGSPKGTLW